jgi:hypothetical protein
LRGLCGRSEDGFALPIAHDGLRHEPVQHLGGRLAGEHRQHRQTFQGSLWTQPSASMTFVKNGVTIEGPMSIGSFDSSFNNAVLIPLPVIKNMPVGAPVPSNTSASISLMQLLN